MSIYPKPTKTLMFEFVDNQLKPGQQFKKEDAVAWFARRYPKIKPATVRMHVDVMSVNSALRKHHPTIRPGSGHDLFYKLAPNQFRLWEKEKDLPPSYGSGDPETDMQGPGNDEIDDDNAANSIGQKEFAFETDLRNYIAKNLSVIESGLVLFDDEGVKGIEYPADGRRIDVLCVDGKDNFVVIELKVSRGYDRAVGQLLRYMGWVKANLAQGKGVRGIIVASNISNDLKIAASLLPDVSLIEYELSFSLKQL